jgi:hypothetical protein
LAASELYNEVQKEDGASRRSSLTVSGNFLCSLEEPPLVAFRAAPPAASEDELRAQGTFMFSPYALGAVLHMISLPRTVCVVAMCTRC